MPSVFYKLGCRAVQKACWAGFHVMPWREPEVLSGVGALKDLPKHLSVQRLKKALIVTDEFLSKSEHFYQMTQSLREAGFKYAIYNKTVPNPTIDNIEEASSTYLEEKCDCIIAFGGGSSIDCAKGALLRIARPKYPLNKSHLLVKIKKNVPYLVAIPTTSGTGSEATLATVITDPKSEAKYAQSSFALVPKLAVLDPSITTGLPSALTASTGMDALTHAVEAYTNLNNFGDTEDAAIKAGKLIVANLLNCYNNPQNIELRDKMQKAAYWAGYAFTRAFVGYVHAIAHTLGGKYGVPHGVANAVILPYVLEAYGSKVEKRLGIFAKKIGAVDVKLDNHQASKEFIAYIRNMNRQMNIPEHILCIKEEDIPRLARTAIKEANPAYPCPVVYSARDLEKLYRKVAALN